LPNEYSNLDKLAALKIKYVNVNSCIGTMESW
jgi:hypothetical protein